MESENSLNIIDCKKISNTIFNNLLIEIEKYKNIGQPELAFITFGNDKESFIYLNKAESYCKKLNINICNYNYNYDIREEEICDIIENLNNNKEVNGIIIQSPLPKHLNKNIIYNLIDNYKDVEGLNNYNSGCLINNTYEDSFFIPCTPLACMEIFKYENINLKGKTITIIGKSNIVGLPLSLLLLKNNATVTVCHIDTVDLIYHLKDADIVISACGQANMIKKTWLKKDVIIIDIGINIIYNKLNSKDYTIVGDVDFNDVKDIAHKITPVPRGLGLITIMMLMSNTLKAFKIQNKLM